MPRGRTHRQPQRLTRSAAPVEVHARVQAAIDASPATRLCLRALFAAGGETWVVGGAVRDALRGAPSKDVDVLVRGLSAETVDRVLRVAARENNGTMGMTGEHFGVFRLRTPDGDECEVALPRTEVSTGPRYQDFDVTYDAETPLERDLERRDFTVNAIALSPETGVMVDIAGGAQDITDRVLRLVRADALEEDPLRTMRAMSARARFDFVPDPATEASLAEHAFRLKDLPRERVRMEWEKFMGSPGAHHGLELGARTGILDHIAPELTQDPAAMVAAVARLGEHADATLRTAAAWLSQHGAGADSAKAAGRFARTRLDLSGNTSQRIAHLVTHAQEGLPASESDMRRFLRATRLEHAEDALVLSQAAHHLDEHRMTSVRELLRVVRERGDAVELGHMTITGSDLVAAGVSGPAVGAGLAAALELLMDDPEVNRPEILLPHALAHAQAPTRPAR